MLREITESEAEKFCKILEKEWQHSMNIINYIKTSLEWKRKKSTFDVSLLYNHENMESGVFIGIMKSGCVAPTITIYAFENEDDTLKQCLLESPINWTEKILFKEILIKYLPIIGEVATKKNCEICYTINFVRMYLPIEDALSIQLECPRDIEFRQLSSDHLKEIYDSWVMTDVFTIEHLRDSLELNNASAFGIFEKNSVLPLSRCLRSSNGDIMALQTIEKARGKGYAKLLIKKVSKMLAEHSIQPFAHAADFNIPSIQVFHSVGYKNCGNATSIAVRQI